MSGENNGRSERKNRTRQKQINITLLEEEMEILEKKSSDIVRF